MELGREVGRSNGRVDGGVPLRVGYRTVVSYVVEGGQHPVDSFTGHVVDWMRSRRERVDAAAIDAWDGVEKVELPSGVELARFDFEDERSGERGRRYVVDDFSGESRFQVVASALWAPRDPDRVTVVVEALVDAEDEDQAVELVGTPGVVSEVLNSHRVFDSLARMQGQSRPIKVDSVQEVIDAIEDQQRQVPLVVGFSPELAQDAYWDRMVDSLTRRSRGVVASYSLSHEAGEELNDYLPDHLDIVNGTVRLFLPRVRSGDVSDGERHQTIPASLLSRYTEADGSVSADLADIIAALGRKASLRAPLNAALRRKLRRLDQEQLEQRALEDATATLASMGAVPTTDLESLSGSDSEQTELPSSADQGRNPEAGNSGAGPAQPAQAAGAAPSGEPTTSPDSLLGKFRRRADRHRRASGKPSFGDVFRSLLARWLERDPATLDESTVDQAVVDLDRRIAADRARLKAYEARTAGLENQVDSLEEELSAARKSLDGAQEEVASYQQRLEEERAKLAAFRSQAEAQPAQDSAARADSRPTSLLEIVARLDDAADNGNRVVFTGDLGEVQRLARADSAGTAAREVWAFVKALDGYAEAKTAFPDLTFDAYLADDAVSGYKVLSSRHRSTEPAAVRSVPGWRESRSFPIHGGEASSRTLMEAHYRIGGDGPGAARIYYLDGTDEKGDGHIWLGYIGRPLAEPQPTGGSRAASVRDGSANLRAQADAVFVFLASRLDGLIQRVLDPHLGGKAWTEVLVALDARNGERRRIERSDPAAQLRMLTTRLGDLGFPFDRPGDRTVSTQAQQLRELRNRLYHNAELELVDLFRANDAVSRILKAMGDAEGAEKAESERNRVAPLLSGDGSARRDSEERAAAVPGPSATAGSTAPEQVPSSSTSADVETASTGADGGTRGIYRPWRLLDSQDVYRNVDIWSAAGARSQRALAREIAEVEGPVSLDRAVALISQAFGISRVSRELRQWVEKQIRAATNVLVQDGFAWTAETDPDSWRGYRAGDPESERSFSDVAVAEIANAMDAIRRENPGLSGDGVQMETLRVFGRRNRTESVRARLEAATELLLQRHYGTPR